MARTPDHNNIDDQSDSVGMAACRPVDMSGIKSSVRQPGATPTKLVPISDDVDECYDAVAYSDCYPVPPRSIVIDNHCNIKPVSDMCDTWTSNASEVMRARAKRFARDLTQAHARRRDILSQMMNLLRSAALAPREQKGCTPGGRRGGARDAQFSQ